MDQTKFGKLKWIFLIVFLLCPISSHALEQVKLHLFYSKSCPHCASEKEMLKDLEKKYSNLSIEMYEVTQNPEYSELMDRVKKTLGTENSYVPYTVIGETGLTGYNDNIARQIEHFVERYSKEKSVDLVEKVKKEGYIPDYKEEDQNSNGKDTEESSITVPVFGDINAKTVSLPLLATVMGAIDGFNPCAMWVLLFLISMLIGMKDRKKMWILGVTFLCTSALIYLLFMVSWLKIAVSITSITWVQRGIAFVALVAGLWNLYSFYKSKDAGCMVVGEEKRKKTLSKIRKITSEKKFILAILGVMALAISVNIVELACSAGLPLVFTQVLALNDLSTFQYALYILIYIFFFLIDDLIVFIVAMITMKVSGISNKYAAYSHLIGGIIMVLIGILLFVKPEWLMFQFS